MANYGIVKVLVVGSYVPHEMNFIRFCVCADYKMPPLAAAFGGPVNFVVLVGLVWSQDDPLGAAAADVLSTATSTAFPTVWHASLRHMPPLAAPPKKPAKCLRLGDADLSL